MEPGEGLQRFRSVISVEAAKPLTKCAVGESSRSRLAKYLQTIKCGATMPMKSRGAITLVFSQNFGKCRWLPVTR